MNARDYLTLLRERKLIISGSFLVCVLAALAITAFMPKSYTSQMTFYVSAAIAPAEGAAPVTASEIFAGTQTAKDRVKSYTELIVSPRVTEQAARALGGGTSSGEVTGSLVVTSTADTVLINVETTGPSSERAVAIATAVATSFTGLVDQIETPPGGTDPQVRVELTAPPTVPVLATSPRPSLNLIIGGLIGLIVGFGLAVARRSMDVAVRSREQLEEATDAAVLGVVPDVSASSTDLIAMPRGGRSIATPRAEAFRRIRTNLEFSNVDRDRRLIVVTSPLPGEGKSTVACNLATALAAVGSRVLLLDADLRRPSVGDYLGLESAAGLTSVLTDKIPLKQVIQPFHLGGFDVISSGPTPPRPNELLSARRTGEVLVELRERYDFVIVDAPPLLPVTDAVNLGTHADGALVVARWGKTTTQHLTTAASYLAAVSVPIIGTVLFRAPARATKDWGTYGGYSSVAAEEDEFSWEAPTGSRTAGASAAEAPRPSAVGQETFPASLPPSQPSNGHDGSSYLPPLGHPRLGQRSVPTAPPSDRR